MEDDTGEKSSFIVGLIENRAKEVGVAAFDLRSAAFDLSQYIEASSSYQNTKTLLNFYDPMVMVARGCFDDTKGAVLVKNLAANEPSALGLDTYSKEYYLCLAAAAAVIKWFTIFATHMENLAELATLYPNVKIVHFDVEIKNKRMDFKFQLKDGPRHVAHYGLMLAGVAGFPSSVIESANSITARMEVKRIEVNFQQHHDIQMAYRVAQRLVCLKYSDQDGDSIWQALQNLKESCIHGGL